jgi:anti-anti-sigma regulatory factor
MKLATTSTMVRMDLAKLDDADNNGATLLMRALAALKRAKKEYVFGSPEHLAQILAAKLVPGERSNEAMWLLLLELYQQAYPAGCLRGGGGELRGDLRGFAAVLGGACRRGPRPPQDPSQPTPRPKASSCTGRCWARRRPTLRRWKPRWRVSEEFDIDAHNLVRIDAASAGLLLEVLKRLHAAGKKLRIIGFSTLMAAYLETLGFDDVAEMRARAI